MPTYVQLASEPVWGAQHTPDAMLAELIEPLRRFYELGPASVGAAGDNNHLYGRHRSYDWDRISRYCTDRNYGTVDARDQGGDHNWYRACDVGITGEQLYAASRRIDQLVGSGRAPGIAEWFGTFDGQSVVGWFQGGPSSSDSSHLYHLHIGFWNESAADAALMRLTYATITGTQGGDDDMPKIIRVNQTGLIAIGNGPVWYRLPSPAAVEAAQRIWGISEPPLPIDQADFVAFGVDVATLVGGGGSGGGGGATPAEVASVVRAELDATKLGGL